MIRYVRLEDLDSFEIAEVKRLSEKNYKKIVRHKELKDAELLIDVKTHRTSGKRKKYSVHLKINSPNIILSVSQADWDLPRSLQKAFNNLHNSLVEKFKLGVRKVMKKKFFRA